MSMKAGYINGERVYSFGFCLHPVGRGPDVDAYSCCQIFKHKDVDKMLNEFLRILETADSQAINKPGGYAMLLYSIINELNKYYEPFPHKAMRDDEVVFDDPRKIEFAKYAKKRRNKKVDTGCLQPTVIKGGLYKSPDQNDNTKHFTTENILTKEAQAFLNNERAPK